MNTTRTERIYNKVMGRIPHQISPYTARIFKVNIDKALNIGGNDVAAIVSNLISVMHVGSNQDRHANMLTEVIQQVLDEEDDESA